jgi:predicted dienelactone hydrolase
VSPADRAPQPAYKAGHHRFTWHDRDRDRPVWADVWFPSTDESPERAMIHGLGQGMAIPSAEVAARGAPFPLVVMSHGASGSAPSYSWIAEYLARNGVVVLGVSHYGESWLYGPDTIDPAAVTRLWTRPADCTFALTKLLATETFGGHVDPARIGALGHSSGGATAFALGGATFDPTALSAYCRSDAARFDRGCHYARQPDAAVPVPAEATRSYRDPRILAVVALDPAAGPGFSAASLAQVRLPVLIVGSEDNDFLPFAHHAGRYASLLPNASLIRLRDGEGHFVYLNSCTSDLAANGVPLCVDRDGVDREAVHARLAPEILTFLVVADPRPARRS